MSVPMRLPWMRLFVERDEADPAAVGRDDVLEDRVIGRGELGVGATSMPSPPLPRATVPVTSVPIRLRSIRASTESLSWMPSLRLAAMTLPAAAVAPPMVAEGELTRLDCRSRCRCRCVPRGVGADEVRPGSPRRLALLAAMPARRLAELPEMMSRAAGVAPPTVTDGDAVDEHAVVGIGRRRPPLGRQADQVALDQVATGAR